MSSEQEVRMFSNTWAVFIPVAFMLSACGGGGSGGDADTSTDLADDEDGTDTAVDGPQGTGAGDGPADDVPAEEGHDTVEDTPVEDVTEEDAASEDVPAEDADEEDAEPECILEGESGPVTPDGPECCEGLTTISCAEVTSEGLCAERTGVFCCSYCGDGACGTGENICNCPEDCTDTPECVPEGESYAVTPDAPECCPGLTPVGCSAPLSDGTCSSCMGVSFCTNCGDGTCGTGENICRCTVDC